ncbi:MAG: transcriptional repressor [Actinomycetota bacterium]|nr:transcriptional repressor [Actinomycetota bacterium]
MSGSGWREHTEARLRAAGHRSGSGRRAVIEVLARHDCLMTANDILAELQGGGHPIGFATVYRALETLTELGLVRRVDAGTGSAAYEPLDPSGEHHHHVVCDRCGEVTPFVDEELERSIARLSRRLGGDIHSHEVTLRGACAGCREN